MNAIEVKNISKQYVVTPQANLRISLRQVIANAFHLKTTFTSSPAPIVALDTISFTVKKGEAIGLIGPNGSGKSTLLRILAGITYPSQGVATIQGKIAALLSLGVGFHPDLTGRENIYLNAAILGYPKKNVEKDIDTLIAFSELEQFIDIPVKYYSSGMYSRLGFSIATAKSMLTDILLVDETLTVGDESFRKKSFARMEELVKKSQTTIIFVSHDLSSIEKLCQRTLWLEKGKLKMFGKTTHVLNAYKKTYSSLT